MDDREVQQLFRLHHADVIAADILPSLVEECRLADDRVASLVRYLTAVFIITNW